LSYGIALCDGSQAIGELVQNEQLSAQAQLDDLEELRASAAARIAELRSNGVTPSWEDWALCPYVPNPDIFFPLRGEINETKVAKKVCAACTVRPDCYNYALETGQRQGIWGGNRFSKHSS